MKKAKRVVLFGIDGGGTFFRQANTPNMDRIFAAGAVCRKTLTEIPTISAECWGGMLHGVECGWHGLTNAVVSSEAYPGDSAYPSVFRVIREAMPEAGLAAFSDWEPINSGIIEEGLGVRKYSARDRELVDPAIAYIQNNDFTFLFFQFDSVDGAGHRYGYGTPEHLAAISENDAYIGAIVGAIEARGWLEDTLILAEADHGGTPNDGFGGHHGGATEAEKYVSFFAAGPGVESGEVGDMLVRDTPAVILHALDIPQPESWTARVPGGLFRDCPAGTERPVGCPPAGWTGELSALEEKGEFLTEFAHLEPVCYLPFESDGEFAQGTVTHGKLYRQSGRVGQGMGFADGCLEMNCADLEQGYSVLFWVRADHSLAHGTGIVVSVGAGRIEIGEKFVRAVVNSRIGQRSWQMDMTCPGDPTEKWTHVAFTLDPKEKQICLRVDFGKPYCWGIPQDAILEMDRKLWVGERLPGILDDLCICRKPLDDETIRRLKGYYQA